MHILYVYGWVGVANDVPLTVKQVAAANNRHAATVTRPLHRRNAVKRAVLRVMHVLRLLAQPVVNNL